MATQTTSTRVMQMAVALALVLFVSGSTSLAQRRGGGDYRGGARTSVNGTYNKNVNVNQNVNVNRNTNVNVDRDVDVHGSYGCCGCCYHSGWGTAAAVATTAVVTAAIVGSRVHTLPPACAPVIVGGFTYWQCGSTWYQPQIAGGSTTYVVINAPR